MNITNVGLISNTIETLSDIRKNNNDVQNLVDSITTNDSQVIYDQVDFSIDYSDDLVSSVLDDIKATFENRSLDMYQNLSVADYTTQYGIILNRINSEAGFDEYSKTQLTQILDASFDGYAQNVSKALATNISAFFNKAYFLQERYTHDGTNMGITGEKLVDEDVLEKNINNVFSAARIFYRNNPDSTKDQLEQSLQENFSETQSLEKLSYNDFTALRKAINISNNVGNNGALPDLAFFKSPSRQSKAMNKALDSLISDNASSILTEAFKKAISQNDNSNVRIDVYDKIKFAYEHKLEELIKDTEEQKLKLKELDEQRKLMMEEYQKKMKQIEEEMLKQMIVKVLANITSGKTNQSQDLTKQNSKRLEIFHEKEIQIRDRIKDINKSIKVISENYNMFKENPSPFIDDYLSDGQGKVRLLKNDSNSNNG